MKKNEEEDSIVYLSRTNSSVAERLKKNPEANAHTVHSFKGKEADIVYIEDDLNESCRKAILGNDKEELRLYYVALSRAVKKIINNKW